MMLLLPMMSIRYHHHLLIVSSAAALISSGSFLWIIHIVSVPFVLKLPLCSHFVFLLSLSNKKEELVVVVVVVRGTVASFVSTHLRRLS